MGTLNWSQAPYGRDPARSLLSTQLDSSGTHATSTTASNVASLTAEVSMVLRLHADEAMRVRFGGATATATTGFYIPAGTFADFEVSPGDDGTVSVIDVA